MSVFYTMSKKIAFVNDLIKAGSTIMAYWPGSGNDLRNIDYSVCHVGVIQYFLKHSIKFLGDSAPCSFHCVMLNGNRHTRILIFLENLLLYRQQ